MNLDRDCAARVRDYFEVLAPVLAVERALEDAPFACGGRTALIFNLQREEHTRRDVRLDGVTVPVVPFPLAAKSLVEIAQDANNYGTGADWLSIYLLRSAFDRVADRHGAQRISGLSLQPGDGADDVTLANLAACLAPAVGAQAASNTFVVDQVALALNTHLAQRYGGMRAPDKPASGCLAPWQLRLARDTLDAHLDGSAALDDLARQCGLSVSHFSRAFSRSTGMPPHRWLMQRRIALAKDLIRRGEDPFAEIALACGFSDQSHLTRAFAKATGLTPGRWRKAQMG